MQYTRAQSILAGQSKMAQRVFSAVPMQEFWSIDKIVAEMKRVEGLPQRPGEIMGCLRCLVDAGLVNETASTTFRSAVKPPKEKAVMEPKSATTKASPQPSLFERMIAQAEAMRTMAEQLEQLAIEVDEALKSSNKGDEKLKALQATLRGLMGED